MGHVCGGIPSTVAMVMDSMASEHALQGSANCESSARRLFSGWGPGEKCDGPASGGPPLVEPRERGRQDGLGLREPGGLGGGARWGGQLFWLGLYATPAAWAALQSSACSSSTCSGSSSWLSRWRSVVQTLLATQSAGKMQSRSCRALWNQGLLGSWPAKASETHSSASSRVVGAIPIRGGVQAVRGTQPTSKSGSYIMKMDTLPCCTKHSEQQWCRLLSRRRSQ
ncbi:unnamed protein product [Heterosigma akashiwo]